jgi:hypothetical protein
MRSSIALRRPVRPVRPVLLSLYALLGCAAVSCGPDALPGFANPPPPPDAASDADTSADDAGQDRLDAGTR